MAHNGGNSSMCKLCDAGMPQKHFGLRRSFGSRLTSRRGFLAGAAATGAAAAGLSLFAPRPTTAQVGIPPAGTGISGRRYLIKGGAVMSMDPAVGDFPKADVLVEGNRIVAVGPNLGAGGAGGAEVIDATGRIVMPGFIDTHHHQFETALRSYLADGTLILDGAPVAESGDAYYTSILLGFAPVYRPQDVYISELFGGLSQLDDGVTTVHDVSQIHHTPQHSDAAIQALYDTGRRAAFGYFEGAGEGVVVNTPGYAYPQDATRIHQKYFSSSDQLVHMIMGGEVYLGAPTTEKSWTLGRQLGLQLAAHILSPFGIRPILDALAQGKGGSNQDIGIGPDNLFIHMTGMSDMGWQAVKDKGAQVSIACPIEMNMRHGMPPILKMQSLGLEPSLSVDVECTLTADFFTQMRSMMNLQRVLVNQMILDQGIEPNTVDWGLPPAAANNVWPSYPFKPAPAAPPLTTRDVLRYATINGAKALRLDSKVGSLTPGKEADIIILDATHINVWPVNQVPGAVVSLMDRTNVETVIVAGKVRKWKGVLLDADLHRLRQEIEASRDYIFANAFNNAATVLGGGPVSGLKRGIPLDPFRPN
jgi:5-methylthioadenosine/S-adenosylhomocysteine deaminase